MGAEVPAGGNSSTDHSESGRISAFRSSSGLRSSIRLGVIAVYSLSFMAAAYLEWGPVTEVTLWSLTGVLWCVLVIAYVRALVVSQDRAAFLRTQISIPLLLVAPALMFFTWMPVAAFVIVVVAYILDLRLHSPGDGFTFTFALVVFVGVFAGLCMVEIENDEVAATLNVPLDALFWAFSSLLKVQSGRELAPVTDQGQALATVVGVCAILAASLFTAQLVSWVVGKKEVQEEQAEQVVDDELRAQLQQIQADIASLRERQAPPATIAAPDPATAKVELPYD